MISLGLKFRETNQVNWYRYFKIIMDFDEDNARVWIKEENEQEPELNSLSDWVKVSGTKSQL